MSTHPPLNNPTPDHRIVWPCCGYITDAPLPNTYANRLHAGLTAPIVRYTPPEDPGTFPAEPRVVREWREAQRYMGQPTPAEDWTPPRPAAVEYPIEVTATWEWTGQHAVAPQGGPDPRNTIGGPPRPGPTSTFGEWRAWKRAQEGRPSPVAGSVPVPIGDHTFVIAEADYNAALAPDVTRTSED